MILRRNVRVFCAGCSYEALRASTSPGAFTLGACPQCEGKLDYEFLGAERQTFVEVADPKPVNVAIH